MDMKTEKKLPDEVKKLEAGYVFSNALMQEWSLGKEISKYVIGVDTYDHSSMSYCLVKKVGEKMEVMLSKRMFDKEEFDEEVKNLAKYFNAKIVK